VALRLALSMLAIQASIGALNDHADRARDAAEKPRKPIPSGLASPADAVALAVASGIAGLALSLASGVATMLVISAGLALGYVYDVWLSRGPWSWLPLALALPVVPIHAWLGSTGAIPDGFVALVPATVIAGAGLALANGLVDLERDARSDRAGAVVRLGSARAWWLHAAFLMPAGLLAVFLAPVPGPGVPGGLGATMPLELLGALRTWAMTGGIIAAAVGSAALRARRPALRERGWELEAVGVAGIGLGWLAGIAASAGSS